MDRNMIDAASGGALGNITPATARQVIENMASNSQQFGTRSDAIVVRGVHDVGAAEYTKKLESKIDALTTLVNQLASNQRAPVARVCGLCTSVDHFTDSCPALQQQAASSSSTPMDTPQAYAANIFNNSRPQHQQQNHDLSTNRYNPKWRNHLNLRWGNQGNQQPQQFQNVQPPPQQRVAPAQAAPVPPVPTPAPPAVAPTPSSSTSLEELVRMMTLQNMQFQPETRASIQSLTNQMGQMATQLNQAQAKKSDKLLSQTVENSRNVSAITLRSGKNIEVPTLEPTPSKEVDLATLQRKRDAHAAGPSTSGVTSTPSTSIVAPSIPLPFPPRDIPSKKMEEVDKEILETFRKVEVNIPLLDAIKQIPRYAKFLKELCTHKRRLKGNKKISMGKNLSELIGKYVPQIPKKCKDPSTFCVPCIISNNKLENAMLDLGASINVMPLSIFKSLSLRPLQPTGVVIQLANRSVAHPTGLVDDVLVRVGELIFPANFYILDMEEGFSHGSAPIILGRPFLKTARTKIDVHAGTLSMEFDDIVV